MSIGDTPVINAEGQWVGDSAGLRGPAGPEGAMGPRGAEGIQGVQGPAGVDGLDGIDGVSIVDSEILNGVLILTLSNGETIAAGDVIGPAGLAGARGERGPQGEQGEPGEVDLLEDSDLDGTADWLEVMAGTDPVSADDAPADADQNGVPDVLQGQDGQNGRDGVGITAVSIDAQGALQVTTSANQV